MIRAVDLPHLVFMDLLRSIVDTTGPKVAKGNLMRIAMKAGRQVEKMNFPTFDDFVAAIDTADTPLARLEGRAVHVGGGVFGLEKCPFGQLAAGYEEFFADEPADFSELTSEFNSESRIARDFKVGLGAGVGPFCVFHQPMRSQAGANITIGGKAIEIFQLACKSGKGEQAFAETLISDFGCDRNVVEEVIEKYVCCYGIRVAA